MVSKIGRKENEYYESPSLRASKSEPPIFRVTESPLLPISDSLIHIVSISPQVFFTPYPHLIVPAWISLVDAHPAYVEQHAKFPFLYTINVTHPIKPQSLVSLEDLVLGTGAPTFILFSLQLLTCSGIISVQRFAIFVVILPCPHSWTCTFCATCLPHDYIHQPSLTNNPFYFSPLQHFPSHFLTSIFVTRLALGTSLEYIPGTTFCSIHC
jgi:hypothetical protein